jgi:PIN domain nuclease of toxin-antitoxin system
VRVLLDTSYLFDLMEALGRLTDAERRFFEEHAAHLYVSAVSIWEMRLKFRARHQSSRRESPFDPNDVIAALEEQDVVFLPMTVSHAARHLETPISHNDPFDELLLVEAQEEGLKLLTADRQLVGHPLAITA